MSQGCHFIAYFGFLRRLQFVEISTLGPEKADCLICREPFNNDPYQPGRPVNRPVSLECGHLFGYSCLATYIFSAHFRNQCPLCLVAIVGDADKRVLRSMELGIKSAVSLFTELMRWKDFGDRSNTISDSPESQEMHLKAEIASKNAKELRERIMICFEAYVEAGGQPERLPFMLHLILDEAKDSDAARLIPKSSLRGMVLNYAAITKRAIVMTIGLSLSLYLITKVFTWQLNVGLLGMFAIIIGGSFAITKILAPRNV